MIPVFALFSACASGLGVLGAGVLVAVEASLEPGAVELELVEVGVVLEVDVDEDTFAGASPGGKLSG